MPKKKDFNILIKLNVRHIFFKYKYHYDFAYISLKYKIIVYSTKTPDLRNTVAFMLIFVTSRVTTLEINAKKFNFYRKTFKIL